MIRYYAIVAALLIYPNSTDATWFNPNAGQVLNHLREDEEASTSSTLVPREKILCDQLKDHEKQSVCDKIMTQIVYSDHDGVIVEYLDTPSRFAAPKIAGSAKSYKCEAKSIENLSIQKRMFWCRSRQYRKVNPDGYGDEPGFFCAGSWKTGSRVYVFRTAAEDSQKVSPIGAMDLVSEILHYLRR